MPNHPEWQKLLLDNKEDLADDNFSSLLKLDVKQLWNLLFG